MARWSPEKTKTVVAVLLYLGPSCARAPGSGPAVDSTTTTDLLPSWIEGVPKSSILDFVARVTREGGAGARFALFVHHDDAEREFAYDRDDKLQQFNAGWDTAMARGWTVVSMKNDWKTVYPATK